MKLFQYWDTGHPPDDVAAWIEAIRLGNPELDHRLYDRDRAHWFIGKHIGRREQRAFEACAVPAMQADYFRLCALRRSGGVYVDADVQTLQPMSSLWAMAPHGLMEERRGQIMSGVILVRRSEDPYINAALRLCTINIENRDIPNVFTATGPGVLNAIRAVLKPELAAGLIGAMDNMLQRSWLFTELVERARQEIPVTDELVRSFDGFTLLPKRDLRRWIGKDAPAYKQTQRHWLHWRGSIYLDGTL